MYNLIMIGEKIKELRLQKNLTQKELASKIFVTKSTISKWESGVVEPSVEMLRHLSNFFGVPIEYFVSNKDTSIFGSADYIKHIDELKAKRAIPKKMRIILHSLSIFILVATLTVILYFSSTSEQHTELSAIAAGSALTGFVPPLAIWCYIYTKSGWTGKTSDYIITTDKRKKMGLLLFSMIALGVAMVGGIVQIANFSTYHSSIDAYGNYILFEWSLNPIVLSIGVFLTMLGGFASCCALSVEKKRVAVANSSYNNSTNKAIKTIYSIPSILSIITIGGAFSFVFYNLAISTGSVVFVYFAWVFLVSNGIVIPIAGAIRTYIGYRNYNKLFIENPLQKVEDINLNLNEKAGK